MSVSAALLLLVGAQTPFFAGALSLQPRQTSVAKEVVGRPAHASFVGGILPFAAPTRRHKAGTEVLQEGAALDSAFPGEPSTCSSNPQPEFVPSKASYNHFAWVHIPKTGTGFVNALANYACRMEPGSDCVDPDFWPGYALRDENVQPCAEQFVGLPFLKEFEWHTAVDDEVLVKYDGSLITMLREPAKHKKSWYAHKIVNEMRNPRQGAEVTEDTVPTLKEWLDTHRGLQVGFLVGMDTFNDLSVTRADLQEAKRRLRENFAFVGLTDRWADSMCLFHATFGGGNCKGCEFAEVNTVEEAVKAGDRVSWEPNDEELRILEEYHDEFDEELLAEARRLFEDAWTRRGVSMERCGECGCATSSKRPETW